MGTSGDGGRQRWEREPWNAIDPNESDQLAEAKRMEMMFRIGYLKALDIAARAMYQNRWKGFGK